MNYAKDYGEALFLLAKEDGTENEAHADAECLLAVLKDNPDYMKLLNTPKLAREERLALIDKGLAGLNQNLKNLVKLLSDKHLAHKLPYVLEGFLESYDAAMGIEHAEVISARPLTEKELSELKDRLEAESGKTVIIKNVTDPESLGGMKLRFMGKETDGTLKTRLKAFEDRLKSTVI